MRQPGALGRGLGVGAGDTMSDDRDKWDSFASDDQRPLTAADLDRVRDQVADLRRAQAGREMIVAVCQMHGDWLANVERRARKARDKDRKRRRYRLTHRKRKS